MLDSIQPSSLCVMDRQVIEAEGCWAWTDKSQRMALLLSWELSINSNESRKLSSDKVRYLAISDDSYYWRTEDVFPLMFLLLCNVQSALVCYKRRGWMVGDFQGNKFSPTLLLFLPVCFCPHLYPTNCQPSVNLNYAKGKGLLIFEICVIIIWHLAFCMRTMLRS